MSTDVVVIVETRIVVGVTPRWLQPGERLALASLERQLVLGPDWIGVEVDGVSSMVHNDDVELVAVDRAESAACELGTKGCCVEHIAYKAVSSCQTW